MIVKIEVTAEDIELGKPCYSRSCPVALAVSRLLKQNVNVEVRVWQAVINFWMFGEKRQEVLNLPEEVSNFIQKIDLKEASPPIKPHELELIASCKPFNFELDIPEDFLDHSITGKEKSTRVRKPKKERDPNDPSPSKDKPKKRTGSARKALRDILNKETKERKEARLARRAKRDHKVGTGVLQGLGTGQAKKASDPFKERKSKNLVKKVRMPKKGKSRSKKTGNSDRSSDLI